MTSVLLARFKSEKLVLASPPVSTELGNE